MTKAEAIEAMESGLRVSHRNFSSDEWMRKIAGRFEFEDGCMCWPVEFWSMRSEESWDNDWKVIK